MPRIRRAAALAGAAALLAGCSAGAHAEAPDWRPRPSFQAEGPGISIAPVVPVPEPSTRDIGPDGTTPPGSPPSSSPARPVDPAVVATGLTAPVGLTLLPDGTALVGERTTGRIARVQPDAGQKVTTVRTLSGLSTAGGGGLLDLAVSPYYDQDGLIYAYVTTPTDNRVVAFTLTGPVTPVLTGIPRGTSDNAGRIAFTAAGDLYVGTGDAGKPPLAANAHSLAGKVLRVTDIGQPAPGNPEPASPMFASGFRDPAGVCVDPATGSVFEVASRPSGAVVNLLAGGATYGWPRASRGDRPPLATLPAHEAAPGGCAVQDDVLYVTSLGGQALLAADIVTRAGKIRLGQFTPSLVNKYGRLRTVVAAPDGALWLTTSNRDGHGRPVSADERVLRIVPPAGSNGSVA